MILKLAMDHHGLKVYKMYINDDPGLTLTYFTASTNVVKIALCASDQCQGSVYRTVDPLVFDYSRCLQYKSNRKAMNRNWSNQEPNPAPKTKREINKYYK